jgi:hypothetical protein
MTTFKYIAAVWAFVGAVGLAQATDNVNNDSIQFMDNGSLSEIQGAKAKRSSAGAQNRSANTQRHSSTCSQTVKRFRVGTQQQRVCLPTGCFTRDLPIYEDRRAWVCV